MTTVPVGPSRGGLRGLGGDALAVGLGQLAAFIYPIVSLPLLTRVLGVSAFGRVVIVVAVLQLLVRLCDYGFSVSAVRRMAVAKDEKDRSSVIFSTLLAVAVLWVTGVAILLAVAAAVPRLNNDFGLYLIGSLVIVGGLAFPSWLLQGLRRLRLFAFATALSRVVALLGLVLSVHQPGDIGWAVVWQFAPPMIAALIVWPIIAHRCVRWVRPSFAEARFALSDGRHLFFSSLAQSLIGSAPVVMLGLVANPIQAAHYGAAERFGNAGRGILFAVTDALMPRMVDARSSRGRGLGSPTFIMITIFALFALGGLGLIIVAPWFVPLYLGTGFDDVVPTTQIIGLALIVSGGIAVFMLDLNSQHRYFHTAAAMVVGAVVHLLILVPLALAFGAIGAAWSLVLGELLIVIILAVLRWRLQTTTPVPIDLTHRVAGNDSLDPNMKEPIDYDR
ncbi:PST family polysaccharide transporter [Brevibacterium epidermidis]|jgi:PST family polysaccharide transporter|uniref:PST family polysaccharide transporter n=1 Tax=Brevibacterium epidermidis TaxID=1698 RepID=A0ABV4EGK3_BREEP